MKKILLLIPILLVFILISCNNSDESIQDSSENAQSSVASSSDFSDTYNDSLPWGSFH